jgi:hypothetical protein
LLSDLPDYQLLTTIPGIGPINAMTILAEAGDLRRFRHHRQFLKFCGMDLATVQSSMFRGQSRISKYGNARLRRTLWMAGQTAVLKRTNRASGTSSNATSRKTDTTPICAARPTPRSRPGWRAQYTPWSITANPIAPSSRGEPRRKDLSLTSRGGSLLTSQIMFGPSARDLGSRIEDGEGRHRAYPVFAMEEIIS